MNAARSHTISLAVLASAATMALTVPAEAAPGDRPGALSGPVSVDANVHWWIEDLAISAHGRYVLFYGNQVLQDPFGEVPRLFVRDRLTATTELGSGGDGGRAAGSYEGGMSEDGRYVVFTAFGDNVVRG